MAIACHKTCFISWRAIVACPKDLWHAIKKFWNIITKVALKVYLQLWRQSHWLGSSVSEEYSKSEHLNGGLPVLSVPIAILRSNYQKDMVCNMFSEGEGGWQMYGLIFCVICNITYNTKTQLDAILLLSW